MRSFVVIELQPVIQISLQCFNGFVVFGLESWVEKLIMNHPVEPLDESVALRLLNTCRSMLDVIDSQIYFVRMDFFAAVFPSVIGKNGFYFDASGLVLRQNIVMQDRCCLVSGASLLLLDEPVAGIAPEMIEKILAIISGLPAKGKTVVLIEHNIEAVMEISDRVIFIDTGMLIGDGAPATVRSDPRVIEAYLH